MKSNLTLLAWRNIRSRRARSWLTILGVLIGVTAIVALISIGTGVEKAVLKEFKDIGYDVVLLTPRGGPARGAMASISDLDDVNEPTPQAETVSDPRLLLRSVDGVSDVGQIGTLVVPVSAGDVIGVVRVLAPSPDFIARFPTLLGGLAVAEGASPRTMRAGDVVLGARTAEVLGAKTGQAISIDGQSFTVVGILAPAKANRGGANLPAGRREVQAGGSDSGIGGTAGVETFRALANTDDALFVLFDDAEALWGNEALSELIAVRVEPGVSVSGTIAKINIAFARQGISMTPVSTQALADNVQKTLGMVRVVLASIAAIALVVGAVGMMNTMYTSVLERTREIGVLKSIGAKDRQVLALFLIDSGLMGLIGGALGLAIGAGLSFLGTSVVSSLMGVASFSPAFAPGLILGVVGFSFLVGALAGAWPAWHAARLDPVQALASE